MKESFFSLSNRLQDINNRIEKEQYNPKGSTSELRKLLKQKKRIEEQLKKMK